MLAAKSDVVTLCNKQIVVMKKNFQNGNGASAGVRGASLYWLY